ncbi:DNA recombination protein RmuC [Gemmatimonas aurantiaca]|nr:DNA recombination protein RmuC [Gemmatimonas aurantiaca]
MEFSTIITIILAALALSALLGAFFFVRSLRSSLERSQAESSTLLAQMQENMQKLNSEILQTQNKQLVQLQQSQKTLGEALANSVEKSSSQIHRQLSIVPDIQRKLGELEERAKDIARVGRDIGQLSEILKPPKLRGGLGEIFLKNLLSQVFPAGVYEMEYSFKDRSRVDAIVRFGETLIPIDSKFPLDTFRRITESGAEVPQALRKQFEREIKGHIDKVSEYIKPEENTGPFALLYLPSEALYAEVIHTRQSDISLIEYALAKRVIITAPSLMYAYLRTIAGALQSFEIARQSDEIVKRLGALNNRFGRFQADFDRVGASLKALSNNYKRAGDHSEKFARELGAVSELGEPEAGLEAQIPAPTSSKIDPSYLASIDIFAEPEPDSVITDDRPN